MPCWQFYLKFVIVASVLLNLQNTCWSIIYVSWPFQVLLGVYFRACSKIYYKKSWNHNIHPTTIFLSILLSWRKLFNVSFITKPKANKGIIIFNGLRLLSSILVLMFEEATNYQYCQCDQYWEDVSPSLKYSSHMSERIKRIAFTINNSIYLYFMVKKLVFLNKWTSKNV